MKCFPFIFEATLFWYDLDEKRGHTSKIAGVGSCINYSDAVAQIEKRYGEDLISIEKLESIGEYENTNQTIIPIKREWIKDFTKEDFLDNWREEIDNET